MECGVKLSNEINLQVEKKEADNSRLEKHDAEFLSDEVIIIPDSVTEIGVYASSGCKALSKDLKDKIEKIKLYEF